MFRISNFRGKQSILTPFSRKRPVGLYAEAGRLFKIPKRTGVEGTV